MTQQADQLAINAIRTLSIDAIEKANSGHPGLPMGAAPMAYTLWTKQLRNIIHKTLNGLTATVLYYLQVMVQCFYIAYFIYVDMA